MNAVILDLNATVPRFQDGVWGVWCLNIADHSWEPIEATEGVQDAVRRARELRRLVRIGQVFTGACRKMSSISLLSGGGQV
ncbi:MAG: hypothetical protein HYX69_21965 [Planctomycetia bacterium]|nr:hypothetical protein [Planctomycetia bacterium]